LLQGSLPTSEWEIEGAALVGSVRELTSEIECNRPDLIVVDLPQLGSNELSRLQSALAASPATAMILLASDRSPEFLLHAMRAGVREVLHIPLNGDELAQACERQMQRVGGLRGGRQGKVLAFVPSKGGSGATFIAANTAYALAARGQRVALIDLNLHLGDAALFVSESRPAQTIADLAREPDRIDGSFLESGMLLAAPNLWVLAAPESPETAVEVKPDAINRIVSVARNRFDYIVLDVGRILDANSIAALDLAEAIYIVLQLSLPYVHDARRLAKLLQGVGYPREKLRLIVNRWHKGSDVTPRDVERSLAMKIELKVPNHFSSVAYSINHGVPILKHAPRDVVSRAITELANALTPTAEARGGWWFGFGGKSA
ncbi:MAG TPA: AAA family ATPase, partial [Burkholderiaceae bacterium]|nr:AAA family ATPase [Burkholderiaceae bacterium]